METLRHKELLVVVIESNGDGSPVRAQASDYYKVFVAGLSVGLLLAPPPQVQRLSSKDKAHKRGWGVGEGEENLTRWETTLCIHRGV